MIRLGAALEGIGIAVDAMGANKLRSALTVLGVVIGVATVMTIASLVQGVRTQIFNAIEVAGPSVFYVMRYFSGTPVNPDRLPYEVRIRPVLGTTDAAALRRIPQIAYAEMWIQLPARVEYQGDRTQQVLIYAADERFMEILGGTLLRGRLFSRAELASGADVMVIERQVAERIFGRVEPVGKTVRVAGRAVRIIGLYQKPDNIFEPPSQQNGGVVPYRMARAALRFDETNSLFISVKPRDGVAVDAAKDAVIVALRQTRNLRPGMPNTFDLVSQDQILDVVGRFTTYFFVAMVALSSVALLVGGIGVMAIMMVSVTDRTREVGLRKALGATRRDILWQFLVEAATLTFLGGLIGIAVGLGMGEVVKLAFGFRSDVPLWSAALASAVSIGIGLVFGLVPANRAARMDPVEALRYE